MSDPASVADLEQRRDRLAGQLVELQWDLGGLAYEMASRDHFRLDVLARQAAKLQQVDAELAEVERMLKLDRHGDWLAEADLLLSATSWTTTQARMSGLIAEVIGERAASDSSAILVAAE